MTEERSGLHRLAVAAAAICLLSILSGAIVTSGSAGFANLHKIVSSLSAVAIAIVAIWMIAKQPAKFGWILLVALLAEGGLGSFQQDATLAVVHACLGQILLALIVVAAVYTGSSWAKEPELVEDHGWPSLNGLGKITPVFVLAQIALGAGFRHKVLGVMPHLIGAMLVVLLVLCVCIFVMQQFPEHKTLRPCANMLMTLTFVQLFLGIAAFTARTITTKATPAVLGITAGHATVGALVMATAVVLHMQIRRNVRRHRAEEETSEVTPRQ